MNMKRVFWVTGFVLCALTTAGTIPANPDLWAEYTTASAAVADGWAKTCGLSQEITVSGDHVAGSLSVGCRAINKSWTKPFMLIKSESLAYAEEFRFFHRASWAGRSVTLRLFMTPTSEEQTAGIIRKKVTFSYGTATDWMEFVGLLTSGEWQWCYYENETETWKTTGGNLTPTSLEEIEWSAYFFPWLQPVEIGDQMLLDQVHFVMADIDWIDMEDLAAISRWYGRTDCGPENVYCDYADRHRDGVVDINDVLTLAQNWLQADLS